MKKLLLILLCVPLIALGQQFSCKLNGINYYQENFCWPNNSPKVSQEIQSIFNDIKKHYKSYHHAYEKIKLLECTKLDICAYRTNYTYVVALNPNTLKEFETHEIAAVIIHELAHFLENHFVLKGKGGVKGVGGGPDYKWKLEKSITEFNKENRSRELECDEQVGFIMNRMGYTLSEAQSLFYKISDNSNDYNSTHPKLSSRLKAVEKGYYNSLEKIRTCDGFVWYNIDDHAVSLRESVINIAQGKLNRGELLRHDIFLWKEMVENGDYFKEYGCYMDCDNDGVEEKALGPEACWQNEFKYTWNQKRLYNYLKYEPTNGRYSKYTSMSFTKFQQKYFNSSKQYEYDRDGKYLAEALKFIHESDKGYYYEYKESVNGGTRKVKINNHKRFWHGPYLITTTCRSWCPYFHENRTELPQSPGYFESLLDE